MTYAERFCELVASYRGTRFEDHGRAPGHALDCVGIVAAATTAMGLAYRDRHYSLDVWSDWYEEMCEGVSQLFLEVEGELEPGDVVIYRHPRHPGHCAVFVGSIGSMPGPFTVDAVASDSVKENIVPRQWRERILTLGGRFSQWRLKNAAEEFIA